MNIKYTLPLYISTLLTAGATALNAQTIIASDNFSDGNRNGWFAAQSAGTGSGFTADASSNALVFNPAANDLSSYLFTYFPSTTLAVGEKLTATFDFTISTARDANDAFRIGLLNSAGTTKLTADGAASNAAFINGYDGYAVRTNIGLNQANRTVFWSHSDLTAAAPLTVVNTNAAQAGVVGGTAHVLANSTVYNASFSIARGAADTVLSFSITGPSVSGFAHSQSISQSSITFDTFVLGSAIGATTPFDSISLDNWSVSVIPEPSAYPALAAFIALGYALTRRRRLS